MSKLKEASIRASDDGYPFETGNCTSCENVKRMRWMQNLRDRLTENGGTLGKQLGFSEEEIRQIIDITAEAETLVDLEQGALDLRSLEENLDADQLLQTFDQTYNKPIYLPPNAILGRKDN